MDGRQLGYFLAIVDHGGFGRAADHLLVAQPSLSQAMAGLERELGVKLFVRAGRGVSLTDAGTPPPTHSGGPGRCTGVGRHRTLSNWKYLPL